MGKWKWLCVVLAVCLVATSLSWADDTDPGKGPRGKGPHARRGPRKGGEGEKGEHKGGPRGRRGGPRGHMSPDKRVEMLTKALDLTEDQAKEIADIFAAQRKAMMERFKAMREGRKKGEKPEGDPAERRKAMMEKMKAAREAQHEAIMEVLTPEQQAKFKEMIAAHAKRGPRRGEGEKKGEGDGEGRKRGPRGKRPDGPKGPRKRGPRKGGDDG